MCCLQTELCDCYLPFHALLHHSKVSVSDHLSNLVLLVDGGGRNCSIAVHCEKETFQMSLTS